MFTPCQRNNKTIKTHPAYCIELCVSLCKLSANSPDAIRCGYCPIYNPADLSSHCSTFVCQPSQARISGYCFAAPSDAVCWQAGAGVSVRTDALIPALFTALTGASAGGLPQIWRVNDLGTATSMPDIPPGKARPAE